MGGIGSIVVTVEERDGANDLVAQLGVETVRLDKRWFLPVVNGQKFDKQRILPNQRAKNNIVPTLPSSTL